VVVVATPTNIRVELFGIARQRAGTASILVPAATVLRLEDVLRELAAVSPDWAEECLDGKHLRPSYLANLNGQRFVRDSATQIAPGDELLIVSADAGG
jgi:molybdopterin converting factor small subunit